MKLATRIRRLEAKMVVAPVVLHFADGSRREICGRGDFLLSLVTDATKGGDGHSPRRAEQLEWIRHCVAAEEPGGGHMVEVVQCMLHAAAEVAATGDEAGFLI